MAGGDAELVRGAGLFAGLPPADVDAFLAVARELSFDAGSILMRDGERGARVLAFFLVLEGSVAVDVGGNRVATRGPGDCLGEIALLHDAPRSATLTAESDVRCLGMSAWDFRLFVQEHPEAGSRLEQQIAELPAVPVSAK